MPNVMVVLPNIGVQVWQISNLQRLRSGEEKKKKERTTNNSVKI